MTPDQLKMWSAMRLGPVFVQNNGSPLPEPEHDWPALQQAVIACQQCELSKTRKQTVFGVGVHNAPVMVIGEAPGADEDAQGEPFVGQAGRLLDQMLKAITHSRHTNVFIANTLKCRPPGNRNPEPAEMQQCAPFLERQVELVNPKVLLLVGKFAIKRILGVDAPVSSLRGKVHQVTVGRWSGPAVVSYHPAYLLRSLTEKSKAWEDLCLLKTQLGTPG